MEEGRLPIFRKRPRVILDGRFPFTRGLDLGDKGQLEVTVTIEGQRLEMDEDSVERKRITLKIVNADMIMDKDRRII